MPVSIHHGDVELSRNFARKHERAKARNGRDGREKRPGTPSALTVSIPFAFSLFRAFVQEKGTAGEQRARSPVLGEGGVDLIRTQEAEAVLTPGLALEEADLHRAVADLL